MRARNPWLPLCCAAALTALPLRAPAQPASVDRATERGVELQIESPPLSGGRVEAPMHVAEVRGVALAAGGSAREFDLVIVLDTSQSTRGASGADVDGDGTIGEDPHLGLYAPGEFADDVYSTDPDDTVLAAEVAAARALLESVDSRHVRVGLVSFAGEVDPISGRQRSPDQQDARLEVPLTRDYGEVRSALGMVLARGPGGATNFAAGVRLATRELAALSGATSQPRAEAGKVILFLTDGIPTFPIGPATVADPGDLEAALAAARVAHAAGIRINSYAIGPNALTRPKAATELAHVTRGTFTPVLEPGAIVAALQAVNFANVSDVAMLNLTTRETTADVRLNPDGSFVGFVPVKEGRNRVLVNAVASNGAETNVELEFDFALKQTEGRMLARELDRLRRINAELLRELEAERVRRERARIRMERELEIRAERPQAP